MTKIVWQSSNHHKWRCATLTKHLEKPLVFLPLCLCGLLVPFLSQLCLTLRPWDSQVIYFIVLNELLELIPSVI